MASISTEFYTQIGKQMAWRLVFIVITFAENKGVNRKLIVSDIRLFIFKYTFALVIAYHVLIPVPKKMSRWVFEH